jgi:hypothetical protein
LNPSEDGLGPFYNKVLLRSPIHSFREPVLDLLEGFDSDPCEVDVIEEGILRRIGIPSAWLVVREKLFDDTVFQMNQMYDTSSSESDD